MKEIAQKYYNEGLGCSRSILMAFRDKYGYVTEEVVSAANAINNGFGIGGMCSALVAGIMVLGLLYEGEEAYSERMKLMTCFQCKFCSINCMSLAKERNDCIDLIDFVCDYLEEIVK
ncbi:MAG: C-GCAxxG-C-C family (seleno)protein [Anaerotignaceae bacterium]